MAKTINASVVKSALDVLRVCLESIKESGVNGIPSGHLYAALNGKGCTIQQYEKIVTTLLGTGLVEKRGNLLRWVGPTK